jgi:hypothetical protein
MKSLHNPLAQGRPAPKNELSFGAMRSVFILCIALDSQDTGFPIFSP